MKENNGVKMCSLGIAIFKKKIKKYVLNNNN